MNGDDVLQREISDNIEGLQETHGTGACKAHVWVKESCIKSLRLNESNRKLLRAVIIMVAINLLVSILKTDSATAIAEVLKMLLAGT